MRDQGFPEDAVRNVPAAVREVLKNIIRHGYRGKKGEIAIRCTGSPLKVTIEILDSAPPYNPLPKSGPVGNSGAGIPAGLGILFVKQAMDIVTYRHEKHRNILTLVKIRRG